MSWLTSALRCSVGKKFVMAITGLLLCGFLVVHLAGNFLLFVGEKKYNDYANALHDQGPLLLVAELGLLALFAAHIYLALATGWQNQAARKVEYARKETKIGGRIIGAKVSPENWMFTSGVVVLGFVLLHLADFRFELRAKGGTAETAAASHDAPGDTKLDAEHKRPSQYKKALRILKDPISGPVYVIGVLVLGLHLGHGFASAFQSLGVNHPRYTPLIRCVSILFALAMALGFASFPLWANFRAP